jgi:hypothetical protein
LIDTDDDPSEVERSNQILNLLETNKNLQDKILKIMPNIEGKVKKIVDENNTRGIKELQEL